MSLNFDLSISDLPRTLSYSEITSKSNTNIPLARGTIGTSSYKAIEVRGVYQGNHPWCWAATCAALTNNYKGTSLTAATVANYVFPANPEQGGSWNDIKTHIIIGDYTHLKQVLLIFLLLNQKLIITNLCI